MKAGFAETGRCLKDGFSSLRENGFLEFSLALVE
jgi:hypothetical protein